MSDTIPADNLRDLYQDLILDHGKRPRNCHALPAANHQALGHNPLCGDRLTVFVQTDADGTIRDAAFEGSGCAISVASASMMTEMLKGKTPAQAAQLFDYVHAACTGKKADATGLDTDDTDRLQALSGVRAYPIRVKCATLAWHTMQAALKDTKKASTE